MIGSHNSWSYLKPIKWWMRPFAFMAKCQKSNIREQYEKYNVRIFDLRIRFELTNDVFYIKLCHGLTEYPATYLWDDLRYLNNKKDVYIRLILDLRTKNLDKQDQRYNFVDFKDILETKFPNLKLICGRELPSWNKILDVPEPEIVEKYSSVCPPKIIDDWWTWLYAKLHNKKNREKYSDKNLLIDYVNI